MGQNMSPNERPEDSTVFHLSLLPRGCLTMFKALSLIHSHLMPLKVPKKFRFGSSRRTHDAMPKETKKKQSGSRRTRLESANDLDDLQAKNNET